MNNIAWKKNVCMVIACIMLTSLTACGADSSVSKDNTSDNSEYILRAVDNYDTDEVYEYTDFGINQEPSGTFTSADGLCTILVYPDYYDVTLDYEKGEPRDVGKAYAETILKVYPQYENAMEPYIYENMRLAFSGESINYYALEERMQILFNSIPQDYKEEIEGFATAISDGKQGFAEDGKISYHEAVLIQMIPDALRPTACSGLSLWGDKTETGKGITLRCLEWNLGSTNQINKVNAVVHMKKGERSLTSISMLGILDMITAINDNGVFAGILDIGAEEYPFVFEGKMCYTYAIRYALEEYETAYDFGNYMVANSGNFTWCHNILITDENNSYCAEDCVKEVSDAGDGFSILRDADTQLHEGLDWESKDSLVVLNSFAARGNQDDFTGFPFNLVRFEKFNKWVAEEDKFSVTEVKNMITQEKTGQYDVQTVHRNTAVHIVLIDYATGNIQVAFTGEEGVADKPLFLDVGNY